MPVNTRTDPKATRLAIARNVDAEVARAGHSKQAARFVAEVIGCHPSTARRKLDGDIPFNTEEVAALADRLGITPARFFPDEPA